MRSWLFIRASFLLLIGAAMLLVQLPHGFWSLLGASFGLSALYLAATRVPLAKEVSLFSGLYSALLILFGYAQFLKSGDVTETLLSVDFIVPVLLTHASADLYWHVKASASIDKDRDAV